MNELTIGQRLKLMRMATDIQVAQAGNGGSRGSIDNIRRIYRELVKLCTKEAEKK